MRRSLPTPKRHGANIPRRFGAAVHTFSLIMLFAASSAPTPLYRLYQESWQFSPVMLTVIFSAYALALLGALLTTGSLSDYLGRRPVIMLALLLAAFSMALFLLANSPRWLIAARLVQGLATGIATTALSAALLDLQHHCGALINSIAPMVGMALGAIGSSALLILAPALLHLVFVILLIAFAGCLTLTWRTTETGVRHPGAMASLRPSVSIPPQARIVLLAISPANIAVWMLGGFYLSLMPSVITRTTTATESPWLIGEVVAALTFSGALAIACIRRWKALTALMSGSIMLMFGVAVILAGVNAESSALLIIGSLVAGLGFGGGFLGTLQTIVPLVSAKERAALMAAFYVECYLANSLPAIAAGFGVQRWGLLITVTLYALTIMILTVIALIAFWLTRRRLAAISACRITP